MPHADPLLLHVQGFPITLYSTRPALRVLLAFNSKAIVSSYRTLPSYTPIINSFYKANIRTMPITHVQPENEKLLRELQSALEAANRIVMITGAGISTSCGIPVMLNDNFSAQVTYTL